MQEDKFPVLKALQGFKMAAGMSESAATAWARSKESEGRALIRAVFSQHETDNNANPHSLRQEAFAALQTLANS